MLYRMIQSPCFKGCCLHFAREHKQNNWNMFQSLPYTSISYHFENNHFCGILHRPYFNRIPHFEPRWLSWRWTTDSSRTYSRISTRWYPGLSRKSCMKGFRGRSAHSRLVIMSELISSSVVQILLYLYKWLNHEWYFLDSKWIIERQAIETKCYRQMCVEPAYSVLLLSEKKKQQLFSKNYSRIMPLGSHRCPPPRTLKIDDFSVIVNSIFFTPPPIRRP